LFPIYEIRISNFRHKVTPNTLNNTILKLNEYEYSDQYSTQLGANQDPTITEVVKSFFSAGPRWVSLLFQVRNKLVRIFGLKTSGESTDREAQLKAFKCEPGERLGLFKVFDKTENEVIIGEDDKHLNFRISFLLDKKTAVIQMTTAVKFHNNLGKIYFFFVKPFHKIIAPLMLNNIRRKI
jgi:hypothetical protein